MAINYMQFSMLDSEKLIFKGVSMSLADVMRMRYACISKMYEYMRANKIVITKLVDNMIISELTEADKKRYDFAVSLTKNESYYCEPDWY